MTGTALVVPREERRLGVVNTGKVDISKAKASLAARGSSARLFPGESLNFKKGRWYFGYSKTKRQRVKDNSEFVMNLANTVETWQTFVDSRPRFAPLAYVILGEGRQPREEMGQLDDSKWDQGDDGNPIDPVSAITVCPIRKPGSTELHHISLSTISTRIAFERLLGEWLDAYEANPGKLPIVRLTEAEEREIKNSGGKTYYAPTFEIVGWEKASKVDNPGPGGIEVASGSDDDDSRDDDEAPKTRKATASKSRRDEPDDEDGAEEEAPRTRTASASRKPTATASKSRRDEPEDEEGEAEAEKPDPRKGNGFSTRRAKDVDEVDPDEEEDDRPRQVRRTQQEKSVSVSARKRQQEHEEEEDEPVRTVRKRRPALN